MKNNDVIAEKNVSEQWRHQALGRPELTLVVNNNNNNNTTPTCKAP